MTITGYLADHWGLLVLLTGMEIILHSDNHLERRMIRRLSVTNLMLFCYSIACYMETCLGNAAEYTILRPVFCALNYSLMGFILANIILIVYPLQKAYVFFPAILNALLCCISIPTGLVFFISQDNHFGRSPLGYLTYFISALYLAYLIWNSYTKHKLFIEDYFLLTFMSLTSVLCLVMPLFIINTEAHWFTITIGIDLMLYYIYLLHQNTKRDVLTKLLNRQSFYADSEKYVQSITAVVAMDMDGLKTLNDTEGHAAGDTALKSLSACFEKAANHRHRIYRIGGDEFVILCISTPEQEVRELVGRIRAEVTKVPYSCSIGFAMRFEGSTIETLCQLADKMLYQEKQMYYARTGKKR